MAKQENSRVNRITQSITFKGGMNKDVANFVMKEDTYLDAYNFELVSDYYNKIITLQNIRGNKYSIQIPNVLSGECAASFPLTTTISISLTGTSTRSWTISSHLYYTALEYLTAIQTAINTDTSSNLFHAEILCETYLIVYSKAGYTITSYFITNITPWTNNNNLKIIGKGKLRNSWIIATTNSRDEVPDSWGQIWEVSIDSSPASTPGYDPLISIELLYTHELNFSLRYPIKIKCDHERSDISKIYLTDNYNYFRTLNLTDSKIWNLEPQQLNILNEVTFDKINIKEVATGGSYTCGKVAYCYQLFRKYGSQTTISPITNGIDLTPSGNYEGNSSSVKGGDPGISANKSVLLNIELNNDAIARFDIIRIIAVVYKDYSLSPELNVVAEITIPTTGKIYFTDTGSIVLSVLSLEEFVSIGGTLFTCGSLGIKDNRLFIANVKEEYFDIDFDARVYRYKDDGGNYTARVYHGTDGSSDYAVIDNTGNITYYGSVTGETTNWELPETYDCILSKADQKESGGVSLYKWMADGSQLGATGPNVQIRFKVISLKEDSTLDASETMSSPISSDQAWSSTLGNNYTDNTSYGNYASPINAKELIGFQRDEVYRIGFVFRDTKGRRSFVKWSCDLKFPGISEYDKTNQYYLDQTTNPISDGVKDFGLSFVSDGVMYTNQLGIHVNLDMTSLPSDIIGYEIVYVKRRDNDKTIVAQGIVHDTCEVNETGTFGASRYHNEITSNTQLMFFASPEVSFNRNISFQSGDSLRLVGAYSKTINYYFDDHDVSGDGKQYIQFYKFKRQLPLKDVTDYTDRSILLQDAKIMRPGDTNLIDGLHVKAVVGEPTTLEFQHGEMGTSLALRSDDVFPIASIADGASTTYDGTKEYAGKDDIPLINYERELVGQYGGNTYADRFNNIYQSTGIFILRSVDPTAWYYVFGGDTFVGFFDLLDNIAVYDEGVWQQMAVTLYPIETTINLALREDTCYSRYKPTQWSSCVWLHETIEDGVTNLGSIYYEDVTDLYLYNHTYSRGNDIYTFIPRPKYFVDDITYDDRIFGSNYKSGGEIIDPWTVFPPLQYKDVESSFGAINELYLFQNKLFCFQDNAICIPSINDRSVVQDTVGNNIVLGSAGLLERVDYVTTNNGCKHSDSIVETPSGLYFFDSNKKSICFISNEVKDYSLLGGMRPYLLENIVDVIVDESNPHFIIIDDNEFNGAGVCSYYDNINKRVFMTFEAPFHTANVITANTFTLIINEVFNCFSGRCAMHMPICLQNDLYALGVKRASWHIGSDGPDQLYLQGYGEYGEFFGTTYESTLSVIFNKGPETKVFDTISLRTISINSNGYEQSNDFFTRARFYNSFQNTGWMNFKQFVSFSTTKEDHELFVRRVERNWNMSIPRNAIMYDPTAMNSKNLLANDNLNYAREFRERMRDKWMIAEFYYPNTDGNLFAIELVTCEMRESFR